MGYLTRGCAAISFAPFGGFSEGGFGEKDGGGIETVIGSNWTLRAEALYVNLDDARHNVTFFPLGSPACCAQIISARYRHSFAVARVGLNYEFGGWK
jgi:hypothetical protein